MTFMSIEGSHIVFANLDMRCFIFYFFQQNGINRTISLNNGTYQYEIKEGIMPGKVLIKV